MLVAIEIIIKVIQFFFGACIFSFLNVVIDRLPRQESVVRGRSHCTKCGRELTALELVPKCGAGEKPLYKMWQRVDSIGIGSVHQLYLSWRKM